MKTWASWEKHHGLPEHPIHRRTQPDHCGWVQQTNRSTAADRRVASAQEELLRGRLVEVGLALTHSPSTSPARRESLRGWRARGAAGREPGSADEYRPVAATTAFLGFPQLGVNVGYQLTDNVRAFVGYTFLYWNDVLRPGDQIDRVVNTTQSPVNLIGNGLLVGPARPAPIFRESDFWAQASTLACRSVSKPKVLLRKVWDDNKAGRRRTTCAAAAL